MRIQRMISVTALVLFLCSCSVTPKISLKTGDITMVVNNKVPPVFVVDYSPDGKNVASGAWDNTIRIWDVNAGKEVKKLKGHTSYVSGLSYSPDGGTLASSSNDNTIRIWNTASGNEFKKMEFPVGIGNKVVISPDGEHVFGFTGNQWTGVYEKVSMYDLKSANPVKNFVGNNFENQFLGKKGRISPNGKAILVGERNYITLKEIMTGKDIWKSLVKDEYCEAYFLPNGEQVLATCRESHGLIKNLKLRLLDAADGNHIKEFGVMALSGGPFSVGNGLKQIGAISFSSDSRFAITGDLGGRYKLWDISGGAMVRQMKIADELEGTLFNIIPSAAFSPDGRKVVVESLASTRLCDVSTGEELAAMIAFEDGEWLVITPNGYYNSSEKGDQYLSVTMNGQSYSIAQLRESFYRPDLVKLALAGGSIRDYKKIADIKPPPDVTIVNMPAVINKNEISIRLKITDAGGGIGDIRLYLNGSAVLLDNARGLKITYSGRNEVIKTYNLKLSQGVNSIRAIAFNSDNTMQSADAVQEITASFQLFDKPSLHALVIGINEYKNPKLQLNYAVVDARLFADTLKKRASALFEKMQIKILSSKEETTRENVLKELKAMQALKPDDIFVLYVASHGTVDDGEYFLITSNVGSTSTSRLKKDAVSQNTIKELIANIPATKKLIVIDTCNAGKLGDVIQTAMLTRGMSEDTAMKVLSRAVGSTILSASTSIQEALEGYHGHGLFTFVVAEGLNGKADKSKSGFVKTTELADYVDNEVPIVAERVFNRPQYPIISISGQGFPIGKVQ